MTYDCNSNGVDERTRFRSALIRRWCFVALVMNCIPSLAAAQAPALTAAGKMDCTIGSSIGVAVGSRQIARCQFEPERSGGSAVSYIGRLERVGRRSGLPAGAKLIWTVLAPTQELKDLAGRYRVPAAQPERDPNTLCQTPPGAICLRAQAADVHWKPNFAATVSAIKFEQNIGRRRGER